MSIDRCSLGWSPMAEAAALREIVWSSAALPPRDQFRAWAEFATQGIYEVQFERDSDSHAPFLGQIRTRSLGGACFFEARTDPLRVVRGRAEVARTRQDFYCIQQLAAAK